MSITDLDGAKTVARRLFDFYDKDSNGILEERNLRHMIIATYRIMQKGLVFLIRFDPSEADIETYKKVLDKDSDGMVTYMDLEKVAIKYLAKL
jgi:Ca2+-binding EF-hand superfamily protein